MQLHKKGVMIMFDSTFKKEMKKHLFLLNDWELKYEKDIWTEGYCFSKNDYKIEFIDELREHTIMFYYKKNTNIVLEVRFSNILKLDDSLDTSILEHDLNLIKIDREINEVNAYFNFLKLNNII
jgi:hypothetical protein